MNKFGPFGVQVGFWNWEKQRFDPNLERAVGWAQEIERLGYSTLWAGGSPPADLLFFEKLLDATESLQVGSAVVNMWSAPASELAAAFHRIEAKHPGRLILGIGSGHRENTAGFGVSAYEGLVQYLDTLDELHVPQDRRVLAALGPRLLGLAAKRSAGALPIWVPPAYDRDARSTLGESLLAVGHAVALAEERDQALALGREALGPYLGLKNYLANFRRLGYADEDFAEEGSDRLVEDLVALNTPEQAATKLKEHHIAGADHVAVVPLPNGLDPLRTLRALAQALNLRTQE